MSRTSESLFEGGLLKVRIPDPADASAHFALLRIAAALDGYEPALYDVQAQEFAHDEHHHLLHLLKLLRAEVREAGFACREPGESDQNTKGDTF